jgi:GGDEF domain-containing protein
MSEWPGRDRLFEALAAPEPRCVLLVDVWNLGAFNYRYGPQRGDIVLVHLWSHMRSAVAPSPVFRLGGDQIVALLPRTSKAELQPIKAAIEAGLGTAVEAALEGTEEPASRPWWIAGDESLDLTFKIPLGINFGSACGDGSLDLLKRADEDYHRSWRRHRDP